MAITNQQISYEYIADGNTNVFPFSCRVILASDLSVFINGERVNNFRVIGLDSHKGGNIVFNYPPDADSTVLILRDIPLTRETDYQTNGDFLARTVNRDFDRVWMAIQGVLGWFKRSLRYPSFGANYNAENRRIENLGRPINFLDAATKNYVDIENEKIRQTVSVVTDSMILGWITRTSFEDGAKLTLSNEVLLYKAENQYYRWTGDLPKIVDANSTPESSGGVGGGKWVLVGDSSLKSILSSADGSRYVGYKGSTLQAEMDCNGRLNDYISKMSAGQTVKIACYGDSTTDGNTTTGWIKNTFGTNHNDDAPNAWPAQLQIILRQMYRNNNIFVFNAGYSGQRLDNGWATKNYENAITENPYYGKCDIVFVGFGINDANSTSPKLLDETLNQTNLLIDKIKKSGALPILLTCNVVRNKWTGIIDNKPQKIERINNLKKYIAEMRNIPFFDLDSIMKSWMQNNNDSYNYADLQPDNTHWGDLGHKYQACWLANMLYNRIVKIDNNNTYESIHFLDARANSPIGSNTTSTTTSCKFGLNPYVPPSKFDCRNQVLLDVWVWCERPDASIVYRRMLGDAITSHIKTTDMLTGGFNETTAGFSSGYDMYSAVDAPEYIGNLKYGLNRVQLIGDDSLTGNTVFGHFDFIANYQAQLINKNILQSIGVFRDYKTLTAPQNAPLIDPNFSFTSDIYDSYGKNVIQLFTKNKTANIYLEGKFDLMSGVFLVQAPGRNKNTISGIMLFMGMGYVSIYLHCYNTKTNANFYTKIGQVPSNVGNSTSYKLTLKTYFNENGYATIDVYHDEELAGSLSWEGVTDYLPPTSGVAGNIYRFCARGETQTINVELNRFEVWYSER